MPPRGAVTCTVTLQELLAGIDLPVGKVTVVPPAVAVTVVPPPQVVPALSGFAITTPLGNVSMSGAVRVAAALLAFVKVMVRVETPLRLPPFPEGMGFGLKPFVSVIGTAGVMTVKVAAAGAALLPLLVCKAPASSVLM